MREIKFRAWDKTEGQMKNVCQLKFQSNGIWHINPAGDATNERILMQYTGLKDKNGIEIYEGDIVKFEWLEDRSHGIGDVRIQDGCANVEFTEPKWHKDSNVVDGDGYWRPRLYVKCFVVNHVIEVIGNIYENPELLSQ